MYFKLNNNNVFKNSAVKRSQVQKAEFDRKHRKHGKASETGVSVNVSSTDNRAALA